MLFACESQGSNGTYLITGASKSKLEGYPQLERVVNQNRASRFFPEEQEEIRQKTASNRSATTKLINDPDFIELMRNQFQEVREWEIAEGYWKQEKRLIDDEVAKDIRQKTETPRARNQEACKARKIEIQSLKQDWKGPQHLVQAKIKEAQDMARNAMLEITGVARQCYHHHKTTGTTKKNEGWPCYLIGCNRLVLAGCATVYIGSTNGNSHQESTGKETTTRKGEIPGSAPKPSPMPNP